MTRSLDPGRVLILGCGPTGCGVAYRLLELGHTSFDVVDAADGPGGLASSVVDENGFTWDLGGHVQFSHYRYYDEVLERAVADGWLWHERESWVWTAGRFVPYPFQHNIHRLDPPEQAAVLSELRALASDDAKIERPRHFAEWLVRIYGDTLAERFFFPYNEKVWGYPLETLAWSWISDRVATPDLARLERNVRQAADDTSWGPNRRFRFPKTGGTGAIWRGVASALPAERLRFKCRVDGVDTERREVALATGEHLRYDTLVTTIPVDLFVALARPLPDPVREAATLLRHSSVHVLGVGLEGGRPSSLATKCWMYFPEANSPYYRVTVFSNYSPHNVPDGYGLWSLMAEVCETSHRLVDASSLKRWTLDAMRADGLIGDEAAVRSFWHRRLEHGYPTPTLGRDRALGVVLPALEERGIYSRGRFGAWKYEVSNQDHSFMQGVELADRLVRGEPEVTLPDPARANSGELLRRSVR